jgi:tetratricopeptide (TPR) repeat protein
MEQEADCMPDPNELRLAANARFAANALDEALQLYSLAVEVAKKGMERQQEQQPDVDAQDPDLVIHLCNRSACFYKMEMYEEACGDAVEAVSLCGDRNSNALLKSLFRLARAQIATKDYSSALSTIKKAISLFELQLENSDKNDEKSDNQLSLQMKEFAKLTAIAQREQKFLAANPDPSPQDIKSLKLEPRTPSIKEFTRPSKSSDAYRPLGEGNFSTVVICQHKITMESFALKIIEKEECKKLAKRQHPNVFNEVAMERRILTQDRLPRHVNIIESYHAMQGELCTMLSSYIYSSILTRLSNVDPNHQTTAICIF